MADDVVVVWDCGSTNLTVIAVDARGRLVDSVSIPNAPGPQPGGPKGWVVWDLDELWRKLSGATKQVASKVGAGRVRALIATTWGADGAPVRPDGSLAYPPICWQCTRTEETGKELEKRFGGYELFSRTGYQMIHFNTLLRLVWLRRNAPRALEGTRWLMMPGLLSMRLCGEQRMDPTSAGTMMAMDLASRTWSKELLDAAGLDESFFPPLANPGEVVGRLTAEAAQATGLSRDTLVVMGGHDTQFAPIGSGARPDEAILSSGTWEILMLRVPEFRPSRQAYDLGVQYELDAVPGLYDPQLLMMGSGVLEWLRGLLYGDCKERGEAYAAMVREAGECETGAGGLTLLPTFVPGTGPGAKYHTPGTLTGVQLSTTRGQICRAALEGLSIQLAQAVRALRDCTGHQAAGIRVVGGGSKNPLWNQIRADMTGLPVTITAQKEATVLGAAIFAMAGAGIHASVEDAMKAVELTEETLTPKAGTQAECAECAARYERALKALARR